MIFAFGKNHSVSFLLFPGVEAVAGNSATTANTTITDKNMKKRNLARAWRSRLRLEEFQRKKENEKQKSDLKSFLLKCVHSSDFPKRMSAYIGCRRK